MGLKVVEKQNDVGGGEERKPHRCNSIYASIGFIDSSPSHCFYLQNSQPAWDLIIFFLRKRESESKGKGEKNQNLFIRKAVTAAWCFVFFFFFSFLKKHLRVISLTLQQMYYSFSLAQFLA